MKLGVLPLHQALAVALERELDLVEVASNVTPPVCRLMDYGKYRYEQTKKEREARKAQKTTVLREVRVRPNIKEHDFQDKMRLIRRLVADGDKVRVTLFFRGRERAHPERGKDLFKKMLTELKGEVLVDQAQLDQARPSLVLLPSKQPREPKKAAAAGGSDAKD